MRPKRYPLAPLERIRRDKVDASAKSLAKAIHVREQAEAARAHTEAERAERALEAAGVRATEQRALVLGELSAADLQRQAAWEARTRWEDEERARQVEGARESEARAHEAEGKARGDLAGDEANANVVAGHRERWANETQRAAEKADEEGAAEAWRPRR